MNIRWFVPLIIGFVASILLSSLFNYLQSTFAFELSNWMRMPLMALTILPVIFGASLTLEKIEKYRIANSAYKADNYSAQKPQRMNMLFLLCNFTSVVALISFMAAIVLGGDVLVLKTLILILILSSLIISVIDLLQPGNYEADSGNDLVNSMIKSAPYNMPEATKGSRISLVVFFIALLGVGTLYLLSF